ncbi:hypothetical protein [Streptomyces sp. BE230]|uniref:hypothetical protein n=1 Tax=Streptomyces sp. BE230 TaxID=3002526 RepID=UPI002ED13193|nr:hypothetical protein [Streptomyces sp. BE230]
MTAFLATLGGKLADTWLSLLVLPGLLYLAVAAAGSVLGHRNPFGRGLLTERIDTMAGTPATHSPGTVVLVAALVLAASAGTSRLAGVLGGGVERMWLGDWPRPLRPAARALTRRRARRWSAADARYRQALTARALRAAAESRDALAPDAPDGPPALDDPADRPTTAELGEARNLIALARPVRPTWMGDRLLAADARVYQAYAIDLTSAWPRLWLLLPDTAHGEIQAARSALTGAARRGAWGLLYVLPALWWWPAALVVAVTWTGAWRQARLAVHEFAELVEATVDLHGRDLATALGIACEERLTAAEGLEITRTLRKGA